MARSTTRLAPSTAWYFAATSFIGHRPPWSTPFDQSAAVRSTWGIAPSSSSAISAIACWIIGWYASVATAERDRRPLLGLGDRELERPLGDARV